MSNELTSNPYVVGPPVSGESLYGRQEVFRFVQESLTGPTNRVIVLHGQRRVGKSSVLQELYLHRLPPEKYCAVRLDVQGQAHTPFDAAVYDLAVQIAEGVGLPEPTPADFEDNPAYFLRTFLPTALASLGQRRLVIMMDEFDALINDSDGAIPLDEASTGVRFLPLLQHILDNHAFEKMVFVLVIGRSLEKLPPSFNQLIRGARFNHIWLLSTDEAVALITKPIAGILTYESPAIERILRYTSGHPYFTQLLCYELFNRAKRQQRNIIEADDVEQIIDTALETGEPAFVWLWDALSIAERLLVSTIGSVTAEGGIARRDNIQAILNDNRIRLGSVDLVEATNHLVGENVLEFAEQDGVRFKVELVCRWVRQNHHLNLEKLKISEMSRTASQAYTKGRLAHEQGDLDAASEAYRLALRDNPNHFNAQLGLAQALRQQGKLEEAVKEFENAYWLNEDASREALVEARLSLAESLEEKAEIIEAAVHYRRIYKIAPQNRRLQEKLKVLFEKGRQARSKGFWLEAVELFERVLDIDPTYPDAGRNLVDTLQAQGRAAEKAADWFQAAQAFRRVTELDPQNEEAIQRRDAAEAKLRKSKTTPAKPPRPRNWATVGIIAVLALFTCWSAWFLADGNIFNPPPATTSVAMVDTPLPPPATPHRRASRGRRAGRRRRGRRARPLRGVRAPGARRPAPRGGGHHRRRGRRQPRRARLAAAGAASARVPATGRGRALGAAAAAVGPAGGPARMVVPAGAPPGRPARRAGPGRGAGGAAPWRGCRRVPACGSGRGGRAVCPGAQGGAAGRARGRVAGRARARSRRPGGVEPALGLPGQPGRPGSR